MNTHTEFKGYIAHSITTTNQRFGQILDRDERIYLGSITTKLKTDQYLIDQ